MDYDKFVGPPIVSGRIHEPDSDWLIDEDAALGFTRPHRFTNYFHSGRKSPR